MPKTQRAKPGPAGCLKVVKISEVEGFRIGAKVVHEGLRESCSGPVLLKALNPKTPQKLEPRTLKPENTDETPRVRCNCDYLALVPKP